MPKRSLNDAGATHKTKRARVEKSAGQKRDICQYKIDDPKMTQQEVGIHFSQLWGVTLGRSTVSDVLNKKRSG